MSDRQRPRAGDRAAPDGSLGKSLAELHVHLEGTVSHATASELAASHGLPPPPPYLYSDLPGFFAVYREVCRCMRTADDFERVIVEHAATMAAQNIAYAEISVNPSLHEGDMWIDGAVSARRRVAREAGIEIAWLIELVREASMESNTRSLDMALSTEGVVGLGLVGDESVPAGPLAPLVARARAAGLRFMPHAGQVGGASVVREALEVLDADRIAHGVSAIDDPAVLELLVRRDVCLCVCPSSNATIGLVPDFRRLAEAGVALTVNTDDPAMVGTTLSHELEVAGRTHGLNRDELIEASWKYRFN